MGKREWALVLAGVVVFAVTFWRTRQLADWQSEPARGEIAIRALAPRFTLADHNRNIVKLERLLGRHRVVLVFFDAEAGVDRDPRTKPLIENFETIDAAGIEVIAVSAATPYANEQAEQRLGHKLPFPVLTDIDVSYPLPSPAHRQYGRLEAATNATLPGLFLIERDGTVPYSQQGFPLPVKDEQAALDALASGQWPDASIWTEPQAG